MRRIGQRRRLPLIGLLCVSAVISSPCAAETETNLKSLLWPALVKEVPKILESQDTQGHFGSGVWIVTDQNVLWPLAVAWATQRNDNPYYHDAKVLDAISRGGDALIAVQDKTGQWTFRKKDNSTWGQIYMPWTYSRWIRAYSLTRAAFPPEARTRWDAAIQLGVNGIVRTDLKKHLENIPAYNATGVYCAGEIFHRDDWKKAAADYLHRIADSQDKNGFWSEHVGPVINYNFVYVDALGLYYGMSHDPYVMPALRRAAIYHAHFTYPDGTPVETVDERNSYDDSITFGGVGFTFTPEGRGYLLRQYEKKKSKHEGIAVDGIASIIAYGIDGPATTPEAAGKFVMGDGDAMTVREGPWFACLSAYRAELSKSRWIQDRQNFLSVFHEKTGLILGGGNTKLQPLWSTFTAGDTSLLSHKPGDEDPNFIPPSGLIHVPSDAKLDAKNALLLTYGDARCAVSMQFIDAKTAKVTYALLSASSLPVEAHVPLLVRFDQAWKTAKSSGKLTSRRLDISAADAGGWFSQRGWTVSMPAGSRIEWPVLPHDQYAKNGDAKLSTARAVLVIPLGKTPTSATVVVSVNGAHSSP